MSLLKAGKQDPQGRRVEDDKEEEGRTGVENGGKWTMNREMEKRGSHRSGKKVKCYSPQSLTTPPPSASLPWSKVPISRCQLQFYQFSLYLLGLFQVVFAACCLVLALCGSCGYCRGQKLPCVFPHSVHGMGQNFQKWHCGVSPRAKVEMYHLPDAGVCSVTAANVKIFRKRLGLRTPSS